MEVQGQLSDCVLRSRLYDYNRGASPLKQGSKCRDALLLGHMILKDREAEPGWHSKGQTYGLPKVIEVYCRSDRKTNTVTDKQTH